MKSIFFYGLFMDQDLLRSKGLNPRNSRPARLEGFGLRIGVRATLERSAGEVSYGAVMELEDNELEALYSGDGVEDYIPQTVWVTEMGGQLVEAVSYLLPMEEVSGCNREYAKALSEIANGLGLPAQYIREIETWALTDSNWPGSETV